MKNNYIYKSLYRAICAMSFLIIVTNIANAQPCVNPPTANAGSNTSVCAGQNYTLGGSIGGGANTATWSTSGTGTFSTNAVFGTATTYIPSPADITAGSVSITLTTDDPDGAADCIPAVSSFTLTINALPTAPVITPSGATTFCTGSSVDLTSSYVTGNTWTPGGATTQTITVSTSGSYSVTYTDVNNCSATSAPTVVTVNGSASITPSGPTTICTGGSVTLTANSSSSYSWAPGSETTQAIVVTTSGTYTVTTTDANSCTATASQTVTVNDIPTASISGTSVICTGMTNTLTATATAGSGTITTYQWVLNGSTNVGTNSPTYGATAAGSYTVRVTNSNSCTFTSAAFVLSGTGPLNGTYTIGAGPASCTNYVSFASAFSDLNTKGISGNVTFNIAGGYTETVPAGGLILKQCTLALGLKSSTTQTITFQKTGGGANPLLTAFTPGTGTFDGIIKIVGVDAVTFDHIDVIENASNTTATMLMEMGYGVFKCDLTDGSVGVTITNCNITLSKVNTSAIGVRVANVSETNAALTGTVGTDQASLWAARNRVNITNNIISNTYGAVILAASAASGPANDSANVVTGNTITNFGGLSTAFTMISASDNRYFTMANNSINGGASTTGAMNGINGGSGPYGAITGNTVTLVSATNLSGAVICIQYGASGANNNGSITNNIVQNCAFTASTSVAFTGITSGLTGAGAAIIVTGNTVQNNSVPGTGTFTGLANSSSPTNLDMSNNIITGNTKTGTGTMNLISQGTPTNSTINTNTITNNTVAGGGATVTMNIINGSTSIYTMNGNIISNNSITGMTGAIAATITGIINGASATSETITNNIIRKLFITGTSTGSHQIRGIVNNTLSTTTRIVRGNTIDSLYTNSSSSAVITGIISNACATSTISKNKMFDFYPGQSTTASAAKGISVIGGTTHTIFNNIIGIDVSAAGVLLTGSSSIIGIEVTAGTNVNMYFNTIRLAGTGSGTAFGSSGISLTVTTANCDIRNNIVNNLTNAGGLAAANSAIALRRTATAITGYASTSNNNIYYAGTPGTNHLIYYDGTNSYQTIGALIGGAGIAPRESTSKTEAVTFQSTASSNANFLKVSTSVNTFVEGGAQTITTPAITDDYFGTTRGPSPDIGAHEDVFPAITPSITSLTASPSTGQCSAVNHDISVVVSPGINPVTSVMLNYSYGVTAQTPIALTNGGSGNTYTGQIPAATPTNANVTWSVTVNDGTYSVTGNGLAYKDDYLLGTSFTATASPSQVCLGTSTTLSVAAPAIVTIGAGATTSALYPNPFYSNWSNTHNQYLITASELAASGLYAGNITSLAITITTGTVAITDVSIKMAHTNATNMSAFVAPAFTTVYSAGTLTPVVGVNTMTFSTPFTWDGVSNVVIEFCWGNSATTVTVSSTALADNTSYVSTIHTQRTSVSTGSAVCGDLTSNLLTYTIRPQFKLNGIALISGFTYAWSATPAGNGLNSTSGPIVTATPTAVGVYTYSVVATDANGCTAVTSPVSVTANPIPIAPTASNSNQCGYGTPTASVVGNSGGIFRWYLNGTGGSPLAGQQGSMLSNYPINATTTFYVSEYDGSCEGPRSPVEVSVTNPDAVTAASSSSVTCPFTNVDLTATQTGSTNSYIYTWTASPAAGSGIPVSVTGSPATIQATVSGTYTYTVVATDASLSCATTSSVVITYSTAPLIAVTPTSSTVCPNTPVQLLANQTNGGGNAINLNGTNQCISVFPSNSLDLFSGSPFGSSFTLEAWVNETAYPTVSPGDAGIFSHYQSASGAGYFLRTSEATTPTPAYSGLGAGGAGAVVSANGTMPLNTWTHLAAIFKYNGTGDTVKIYKNGVLLVKGYTTIGHSPDSLRMGADFGARFFNGKFDEMRIWNVELDTVTLNNWKSQPITASHPNFANLVLYYNFDAPFSTTVTDLSGNGNTGYLRNGPTQIPSAAPLSNVTYSWSPTSDLSNALIFNPVATAPSTVTYTVTATSPNSCFATASSVINVIPNPPAPSVTNNSQCGVGIPTASVSGTGGTFKWYLVSTGGTALAGETGSQLTAYSISTTTTFYVSEVSGGLCEGPRSAVVQTVTNPDAVAISQTSPTCLGDFITLTANQSGPNGNAYVFTWTASPAAGSGISSPMTGVTITINPTAAGTYTYTVNADDGPCTQIATQVITVTAHPSITAATATPNPVCQGNNVVLSGTTTTGGALSGVFGTAATTSTVNGIIPYPPFWESTRLQYLFTASEMTAAGFSAGNITQIKFKISASTATVGWTNYTIRMGLTSNTALTTTWENPATTVFGPVNLGLPAVGTNTHTLTTPFAWNGTSNLVVDICYVNDPNNTCAGCYSGNASITVPYTTTSFNSVHYYQIDNASNCGTVVTGTLATTRPNMELVGTNQVIGTGGYNWQWNPGAINSNVTTVTPNATTTYTVTATDPGSGCTSSQDVVVNVNPVPVTPAKQDDAQCGPGIPTCYVTGSGGGFYRWYLAPTGGTPIPGENSANLLSYSINTTTTFYVTEYDGTCESPRVAVVQSVSTPGPITASATSPACLGSTINLTISNPTSYSYFIHDWTSNPQAGSGLNGVTSGDPVDGHLDVTPTAAGTYTYSVLASDGVCNATANVVVTVSSVPGVTVTPLITTICPNVPVQLTASQANGAGNSVLLNGTNQYLAIPSSSSLEFSVGAGSKFTIEAWIRPTTFLQFGGIVSKYQVTGQPGYFLRENTASPYTGIDAGGSGTVSTATGLLVANNWYHVAAVFFPKDATNDSVRIYINGALVKLGVTLMPVNTDSVKIGSDFSSRFFNGQIDEVRIWNDSLTSSTISSWRTRSVLNTHPNFANLVAYYNMDNPTATTVPDLSGNGNTAYIRNSPSFVASAATISNVTFSWSPTAGLSNSTIPNPVATTPTSTTYTVTVTEPGGCTSSASSEINISPTVAPPAGTNGTVCGIGVPNCSAVGSGGGILRWYLVPIGGSPLPGENGSTLVNYSISATTTFYVTEYDGTCESLRTPVVATQNNPDPVTATANPNPICGNSPLTLNAVQNGSTNTYTYSWTASPVPGSGMTGIQLGPLTSLYSNDFSTGLVGNDALSGTSLITGGELEFTNNTLSQLGAFSVLNPGAVSPAYLDVSFNLTVTPAGGADGFSYSFGDDVSATSTTPSFETGTGTKFKLSFDAYTNGANTNGIYLMYNTTAVSPAPGDAGVIAYSSNVSWRGATNSAVSLIIDDLGRVTLTVGGNTIFSNVQLPNAYVVANKSSWFHVFKARTGGISELHHIDNLLIQYKLGVSSPTIGQNVVITPTAGGSYVYTVLATDAGSNCATSSTVTVNVTSPPVISSISASPSTICLGQSSTLTALTNQNGAGYVVVGTGTVQNTASTTTNMPPYGNYYSGTRQQMLILASDLTASGMFGGNITSLGFDVVSNTNALGYQNFTIALKNTTTTALTTTFVTGATQVYTISNFNPTPGWTNHVFSTPFVWDGVSNILVETYFSNCGITGASSCSGTTCTGSGSGTTYTQNAVTNQTTKGYVCHTIYYSDGASCNPQSQVTATTSNSVLPNMKFNASTTAAGPGNLTWTWSPGNLNGNTQIVSPTVPTTYTVVATDPVTNCTTSGTVTVDVLNAAQQPIIGAVPSNICGTGTSVLTITNAQSGVTYMWESSPTGLAGSWTAAGTGTTITTGTLTQDIYFQVSATCGAGTTTSAVQLISVVNPHITSVTGATRCGVGQVTLSVTGTGSFDWFTNSSGGTALATNTATYSPIIGAPTSFWVQAYIGSCLDPAGRQVVTAFMNPAPAVNVNSNHGTTMCNNQSLTLTATSGNDPNYSYAWSTNGGATVVGTGNILNANPTATTTYYLLAQDNSGGANAGCANVVNTIVTVNPAPPIPVVLPASPAVCSVGGCVDLTVQGATVATQQIVQVGTGTTQNAATGVVNLPPYGNYYTGNRHQMLFTAAELTTLGIVSGPINSLAFDVVSNTGVLSYKNFNILMGHSSANALTTTFETSALTLVYSNPNIGNPVAGWNTHVFQTPFIWNGTSNLLVEVDFSNCTNCTGGTACGTTGSGVTWAVSAITNQTTTSFVSHNFYYSDVASCNPNTVAGASSAVSVRPNVQFNALTGSPITYTWNPGSLTGPTVNVCPSATTTYTVIASLTNTCTSSATVVVGYDPIVTPTITPSLTSICPGTGTTLDAGSGYSNYSWSDGSGIVGTTAVISVTPAVTTTYTLTVDNNGICSATSSVVITVANLSPPTVTAVNNDPTTFCSGGSVTLDAGSPYDSYSWSNGSALGASQTQAATTAGTYVVTVTKNGCTATSSGTVVTVNPNPPTALIAPAGPINLCSNGSNSPLALTADITGAGAGATIVWNQDGNPSTPSINVSAGDIDLLLNGNTFGYYFQVTNNLGCSTVSNIVTVNEVSCGGPTLFAKLYLEGYYTVAVGNTMDNVYLPPLGGLLYHVGLSSDVEDVDYVTLSAMDENPPYGLIESQTGIIKRNGTIQVAFSSAVSSTGQYYIRVNHRNALETWSAAPVVIGATTSSSRYDFTTAASKAYDSYQADLGDGNWALYSGDISDAGTATVGLQDDIVESQDYGDMENAVFYTYLGYVPEDITGDGIVDSGDYGLIENNVYFTRVLHRPF